MTNKIRPANIKDSEILFDLFNSSEYLIGGKNDKYTVNDIKDYIKNKSNMIVVYESDKKVLGLIYVEIHKCYIYVADFVVDSKYRNCGIGNELLAFIEKFAISKNIGEIEMFVESTNKNMLNFVQKRNYCKGKKFIYCSKELK
jgi:ribosomal protein S18 acetylase RimI-like enzyme